MKPFHLLLAFSAALTVLSATVLAGKAKIGICYGTIFDDHTRTNTVLDILKNNRISRLRLFNPHALTLQALKGTGIELLIGVPNENLTHLSTGGPNAASQWLDTYIFAHISPDQVPFIAVGNEVLLRDTSYGPHLVPAMRNLYQALKNKGFDRKIKLSSPLSGKVLVTSTPPSAGKFKDEVLPVIRPLLAFLKETDAPLMANVYPFFAYAADPKKVSLSFAVFSSDATPMIDGEIKYTNLYEASLDAYVAAMEKEGYKDIPLMVTETGWPSAGSEGSGSIMAAVYNNNVIVRASNARGTPRRPGIPVEVFLFDLLDEDIKEGPEYAGHFGIFNWDGSLSYSLDLP